MAFSSSNQAGRFISDGVPTADLKNTAPSMFYYPVAAAGSCIVSSNESAKKIIERNGVTFRGRPTGKELEALALGVGQVERLLGNPLPRKWQTPFNYINTSDKPTWNQGVNAINIRRLAGTSTAENVAGLMHELGHRVGNAGEYSRYKRYVAGEPCGVTTYAKSKDNEQFAEAFSAFVTYPDRLAKSCPKSYAFFSEKLFPNSAAQAATCKNFDNAEQGLWNSSVIPKLNKKESGTR